MKISAKDVDYRKLTSKGRVTPERDRQVTKETIKANIGLLGMKGKHFKSLMKEKIKERLT